jgi:hypothetical protein
MELTDGVRTIRLTKAEAYHVVVEIFKTPLTDLYLLGDILYGSHLTNLNVYPWQFTFVQTTIAGLSGQMQ